MEVRGILDHSDGLLAKCLLVSHVSALARLLIGAHQQDHHVH